MSRDIATILVNDVVRNFEELDKCCKEGTHTLLPDKINDVYGKIENSTFDKLCQAFSKIDRGSMEIYYALEDVIGPGFFGDLRNILGIITFKNRGNCFMNPIKISKEESVLTVPVFVTGYTVHCMDLKMHNCNIFDIMDKLYEFNKYLRIDYTLSKFMSYESKEIEGLFLDSYFCNLLRNREGLYRHDYNMYLKNLKIFKNNIHKERKF